MNARNEIRYKPQPTERALWTRFWLWIAFCIGLELLLAGGLQSWWGEDAKPAVAFVTLAITIFVMAIGGYALDGYQSRDQWEAEGFQ